MMGDFRINNFDLLRLFAAVEVLFLHSFSHLQIPHPAFFKVMEAFPGVAMFFVMSGFLISASLERNNDLKTYFKNRALRIFPALWACLILTIIVISFVSNISFFNREALPWFFSQLIGLIYTPKFLSDFGFGSYNGSLWTIPLELQFYVVLPIIYMLIDFITKKDKSKTYMIIVVFIIFVTGTCLIRLSSTYFTVNETINEKILRYTFIPNIYLFLLGVVLQRFKVYQSRFIAGKGIYWAIVHLLISYLMPDSKVAEIFKLLFLGITAISLAYTMPSLSKRLLRGNDISYGVYIYHGLVLGVIVDLGFVKNSSYVLLIFVITIFLAILSWLLIEKPLMKKKKKTIKEPTQILKNGLVSDFS